MLAKVYFDMSKVYESLKEYDKSIQYLLKLDSFMKLVTNNTKNIEEAIFKDVGKLYKLKGDHCAAINYLEKSLKLYIQKFSYESAYVVLILINLGKEYMVTDKNNNALQKFLEAEKILLKIKGNNNFKLFQVWNYLSLYYCKIDGELKSSIYTKKYEEIRSPLSGCEHIEVTDFYWDMRDLFISSKSDNIAVKVFSSALKMWKSIYGEKSDELGEIWQKISEVYFHKENYLAGVK